jgi:hypothetical protein
MVNYHHAPFADFAMTGKSQRQGNLSMTGDSVFSYSMKIATVNREAKTITLRDTKVSKTTSMHQGAVRLGHVLHLSKLGWELITSDLL